VTPAPPWLHDEPELLKLLHAALDRFDQQSAAERQRPTWIAVEKYLPTLARLDANADQLWRFVRQLADAQVLAIRPGRPGAYDAEWQGAKLAFNANSESTLRDWLGRPASLPPMAQWRAALEAHAHLFEHGVTPLSDRRIAVSGKSAQEVVRALASLGEVNVPATLRQLSAFAFWGDSKILDDRGDLIAAIFPRLVVRERPIVVAVRLPDAWNGVLFIENQDTYTAAIRGEPRDVHDLALVYLSGFKLTASRIREHSGATLHFSGALNRAGNFSTWWFAADRPELTTCFWGDLDFSGMQMLKSLRQRFGDVRAWQPGYAPMLIALEQRSGRLAASDSMQIDPGTTGCAYADSVLLPAIRRFGLWDQERLPHSISQTNL